MDGVGIKATFTFLEMVGFFFIPESKFNKVVLKNVEIAFSPEASTLTGIGINKFLEMNIISCILQESFYVIFYCYL